MKGNRMNIIGRTLVVGYMWFVSLAFSMSFLGRWYIEYTHPIEGLGFDIVGALLFQLFTTLAIPIVWGLFLGVNLKGKYKDSISYFSMKFFVLPFIFLLLFGYLFFKGFLIYSEHRAYSEAQDMNATVSEYIDSRMPSVKELRIGIKRWSYHRFEYI